MHKKGQKTKKKIPTKSSCVYYKRKPGVTTDRGKYNAQSKAVNFGGDS